MTQEDEINEFEHQDKPSIDNISSSVSPIPVVPQLSVALALLVFVFGVTYMGATNVLTKETKEQIQVKAKPTPPTKQTVTVANAFKNTDLIAKSAIVWDVNQQKILFNKNADDRRPLASITKLMTALVAYELLDTKKDISISAQALRAEGDSGLRDGERFSIQDLMDLTLISSSNDGASALGAAAGTVIDKEADSEKIFVEAMNIKAKELGLSRTHFENSTGLDLSETEAGAYGSARDVALLMEYIITHTGDAVALTGVDSTRILNEQGEYHTVKNTNDVVGKIEGLIASKTGYTLLAGGNLVVAVNMGLNRPMIFSVLGSTEKGRFDDILTLIEDTRTYIENQVE